MPDFAKHSVREIFHELKKFFVTFSSRSSHAKQNKKTAALLQRFFKRMKQTITQKSVDRDGG
jgi:hypothetical protein